MQIKLNTKNNRIFPKRINNISEITSIIIILYKLFPQKRTKNYIYILHYIKATIKIFPNSTAMSMNQNLLEIPDIFQVSKNIIFSREKERIFKINILIKTRITKISSKRTTNESTSRRFPT